MDAQIQATRYFCHTCNIELDRISTDFKCPQCLGGFIEELSSQSSPTNQMLRGLGANNEMLAVHVLEPANEVMSSSLSMASSNGGSVGRDLDFISVRVSSIGMRIQNLESQLAAIRNLVDNNIGPPPLESENIEGLPLVPISQEQVDRKLNCNVCFEDFQFSELVKKLPCTHVFHNGCISPWLSIHGTCPICRISLVTENAIAERAQIYEHVEEQVRNIIAARRRIYGRATGYSRATTSSTNEASSSSRSGHEASVAPDTLRRSSRLRNLPPLNPNTMVTTRGPSQSAFSTSSMDINASDRVATFQRPRNTFASRSRRTRTRLPYSFRPGTSSSNEPTSSNVVAPGTLRRSLRLRNLPPLDYDEREGAFERPIDSIATRLRRRQLPE